VVYQELPSDLFLYQASDMIIITMKKQRTYYKNKILSIIGLYHQQHPLSATGRNFQELLGIFGNAITPACRIFLPLLLQEVESSFKLRKEVNTWVLHDFKVVIKEDFQNKIKVIENYLLACGNNVPLITGINETAEDKDISEKELKQILQKLIKDESLVYYQSSYLHITNVNKARAKLISFLKQHVEGISLAQFRDIMNTNRKMASLLLEYFDTKQISVRKDNVRQFTVKYKKYLQS
jgi:selenocysteine-specific elongation factor